MNSVLSLLATVAACAVAISPSTAQPAPAPPPSRTVVQSVTSSAFPRVTVQIDPSLTYLGRGEGLAMNDSARFERFLFGEVKDGTLMRAAIVHFEQFVENKPGRSFDYPRFRMATLGGAEYLHQVWPMPENEILDRADLRALLAARGIAAGGPWLVGRYARAVDPAKQHEILIFYMESEAALGSPVEPLIALWTKPMGPGIAGPEAQALERAFIARQQAAVRVLP